MIAWLDKSGWSVMSDEAYLVGWRSTKTESSREYLLDDCSLIAIVIRGLC